MMDRLVRMYEDYAKLVALPRPCVVKVIVLTAEPLKVTWIRSPVTG